MGIADKIEVAVGDIGDFPADLLVLKYAGGHHGADAAIARRTGYEGAPSLGQTDFAEGHGIAADEVAFVGVESLYAFRYNEIRAFGNESIRLAAGERPGTRVLATTLQGAGYGLDERESFESHLAGLVGSPHAEAASLDRLVFVELIPGRARRLRAILDDLRPELVETERRWASLRNAPGHAAKAAAQPPSPAPPPEASAAPPLPSETKPKLFVAMPYADIYDDEYYIGFEEAAHPNGFLCESLKYEIYTGDIVDEIEKRIRSALGMIALLNEESPNVFLEVGYALALGKPIIFVARKGTKVPFDIRNQRCIFYTGIHQLRDRMKKEIDALGQRHAR